MKKHLIIGLSLLIYSSLNAQENGQSLYFTGGGGLHNISYDLKNGSEKGGFGYSFNAGYGYFLNKHWGLQSGIGLQSYVSTATLNYNSAAPSIDSDGTAYEFRTIYNNWQEKQQLLFLDIPLGFQYRHSFNNKLSLLAVAGLKISVPLKATFESTGGEIVTSGFYKQWNIELKDMPRHGFDSMTDKKSGDIAIKCAYSGFADLGVRYGLSKQLDLYAGLYANYGLNNVLKNSGKSVYQEGGIYNGVLASDQTETAKVVAFGLKVGVVWYLGHKKEVVAPVEAIQAKVALQVVEKLAAAEPTAQLHVTPVTIVTDQPVAVTEDSIPKISDAPNVEAAIAIETKIEKQPESAKKEDAYTKARTIAESTIINFKFNSDQPINPEDNRIKALSKILKANPRMSLHIIGHTDRNGSRKVNQKIGLQRAEFVRQKFLKIGVRRSQLRTEAKTYDVKNRSKTSSNNNAENRVVTFVVK